MLSEKSNKEIKSKVYGGDNINSSKPSSVKEKYIDFFHTFYLILFNYFVR